MGKIVDRIVLYGIAAAALYLLFFTATGHPAVSALPALFCCAVWIHFRSRRPVRTRMTRAQAQEILNRLAYADDETAEARLTALLKPVEGCATCYLPRHPSASVSIGDVFGAWKKHRGQSAVRLIAPCRADPKAKAFARTLQAPTVEIADAFRLLPLIRRSDIPPPRSIRGRALLRHIRELLTSLPLRRSCAKHALYGSFLFSVYLITGNAVYLFLAAASFFLAAAAWRMRRT